MLTKNDLDQVKKVVKQVVREEIEAESQLTKDELSADIKSALIRLMSELNEIKNRLKDLEIGQRKIQKDLKMTTNFLDKEHLRLLNRVEDIEDHLKLSPPSGIA